MFKSSRPRLSYANTMSTLAVFVALGGTSVAAVQISRNSIHSDQIANGQVKTADLAKSAVTSVKVADGSLRAVDFKAGQLKPGPTGPQGAPGAPGAAGPKGDPGATSLKVRTATAHGEATATCAAGERATGGGGHSATGALTASAPVADPLAIFTNNPVPAGAQGYTPTSWTAAAVVAGGVPQDVTAWVVCATP
jgi:hypothetical protein